LIYIILFIKPSKKTMKTMKINDTNYFVINTTKHIIKPKIINKLLSKTIIKEENLYTNKYTTYIIYDL